MMWGKGDLVYIPSNTRLSHPDWHTVDYDEDGNVLSATTSLTRGLKNPNYGIVLDHEPFLGMRKLFIPNEGWWYVQDKDIYEPRRKQNEISRSNTGQQHACG